MRNIVDIGQIPKHVPLYIYGVGGVGRALLRCLIERPEFIVQGLIDSKTTGALEGRSILHPDEFAATRTDGAVVLIASQYHDEIARTLNRLGIAHYFNAFPVAELVLMQQSTAFIDFTAAAQVKDFYDRRYVGSYMDEWDEGRQTMLVELFRGLGIKDGARILDFGCGSGALTRLVKDSFPNCDVWGLDISEAAIAKASRSHPDITFRSFEQLEDASMARLSGSFDVLFSHHVLEHVYDPVQTAGEMERLLKPRSVMLHLLPCGNPGSLEHRISTWYREGIDAKRGGRFFFEDQGHLRRLNPADVEGLFAPCGYRLDRRLFTNQFWGAINWISDSPPVFIRSLCNGGADDALFPSRLRVLRRLFLTLHRWRRPADGDETKPRSWWRSRLDGSLRQLAASEWRRHADRPNGSEMVLFFSRDDAPR